MRDGFTGAAHFALLGADGIGACRFAPFSNVRALAPDTSAEGSHVETIAEETKSPVTTVKRPDFTARVSRTARGITLYVQSSALHSHLSALADGRTVTASTGRTVFNLSSSRFRSTSLFTISDAVTLLLLDSKLDEGYEIKIAEVMTANAAKEYVRDLMTAFQDYVRDYMSALRITGTVTIDETVLRRTPIAERA